VTAPERLHLSGGEDANGHYKNDRCFDNYWGLQEMQPKHRKINFVVSDCEVYEDMRERSYGVWSRLGVIRHQLGSMEYVSY
jgi:hypothetical protein